MDKNKSKKIKVIIIAEICAVVVIAGVVGGIIYHKNKVKKVSTETTLENTTQIQISDDTTAVDESTSELLTDATGSTVSSLFNNTSNGKTSNSITNSTGKTNNSSNNGNSNSGNSNNGNSNSGNSNTTTTKSFAEQVANYRNNTNGFSVY